MAAHYHGQQPPPAGRGNWLAKVPTPDQPDQVWVADLIYIDTGEGWLYLAGVLDACTRRLVGWQTGEALGADLVT